LFLFGSKATLKSIIPEMGSLTLHKKGLELATLRGLEEGNSQVQSSLLGMSPLAGHHKAQGKGDEPKHL